MTTSEPKRGIKLFRAADAAPLDATDFMTRSKESARMPEEFSRSAASAGEGADIRVLVRDASGFSLVHAWFKPDFPLPRHSHSSDCMYYVISGSAVMGRQTLHPGDAFFVPDGAPYQYAAGPDGVEVLEIRHGTAQFDIKLMEHPPAVWRAMAETMAANAERWKQLSTSPTFGAKRAATPAP